MHAHDSVFTALQGIVADTLGVEDEEVVPEAHWECDLAGESIDLLDLTFRLERHFAISIRLPGLSGLELATNDAGYLTPQTLAKLGQEFPYLELTDWTTRPFTRPLDLITIGSIAALVRSALALRPAPLISPTSAAPQTIPASHGN